MVAIPAVAQTAALLRGLALAALLLQLFAIQIAQAPAPPLPPQPACASSLGATLNQDLDVYWLNLATSQDRRQFMTAHLAYYGLRSHRVPAQTPLTVHVPREIWTPDECKLLASASSSMMHSAAGRTAEEEVEALRRDSPEVLARLRGVGVGDGDGGGGVIVDGHCGRPKNSKRELAVTASHLRALYLATRPGASAVNGSARTPHSAGAAATGSGDKGSRSSAPYALILEDDLQVRCFRRAANMLPYK